MHLSDLKIPGVKLPPNASKIKITSISSDSRLISKGTMFAAIRGYNVDGHDFIDEAISLGAGSILVDKKYKSKSFIPITHTNNVRKSLSLISAKYHSKQPDIIASVTGTNGKTSVCHFLKQIWELSNFNAASLGTLGLNSSKPTPHKNYSKTNLTTLDPVNLYECLSTLKSSGVNRLALEASSQGLEQYRLDGLKFSLSCFTNLSHDHLDYHKTEEEYKNQKFRLFTELLQETGTAVINIDDPKGIELTNTLIKRNVNVISYGINSNSKWRIVNIYNQHNGKILELKINNQIHTIPTGLNSKFQIHNAVAAAALANASGIPLMNSVLSIRNLTTPKGRMEQVPWYNGPKVFVDFCHTPDALDVVLKEQKTTLGKLILVIGCGGNRDQTKRSKIGEVAGKNTDIVIVTDDNPRSEDPKKIRLEIIRGSIYTDKFIEIGNRKKAISFAIQTAKKEDVIIIAGKGHEEFQEIKNKKIPFNDVLIAKYFIAESERSQ